MDGFYNGGFPVGGYTPVHKGVGGYQEQMWTPNFEVMEGMRFGQFYPAPYLPEIRFDQVFKDSVVIPAGCPVALDQNGYLVPAGYKAGTPIAVGTPDETVYSKKDLDFFARFGIKNAAGTVAPVAGSAKAGVTAGYVIGVASYDVFRIAGKDPQDPGTFFFHNYQRQSGVAVLTDYLLEFPIEPFKRKAATIKEAGDGLKDTFDLMDGTDAASIWVKLNGAPSYSGSSWTFDASGSPDYIKFKTAPAAGVKIEIYFEHTLTLADGYNSLFKGMTTFRGAVGTGDLITFDGNSKFVKAVTPVVDPDLVFQILGKVTLVDKKNWPKQLLDKVRTAIDPRFSFPIINPENLDGISKLDQQAGSATQGVNNQMWLAGQTEQVIANSEGGLVRFNMNI